MARMARFSEESGYNEPMSGKDTMKPAGSGVKLTYDDFLLFPDDGKRHELIDGEHYVTPSPARKHQKIAWNLNGLLWVYLQNHPVGEAFGAPFDVVFSIRSRSTGSAARRTNWPRPVTSEMRSRHRRCPI